MIRKRRIKERVKSLKCFFCQEKTLPDYKDPLVLKKFITERSRILSRSRTGFCAKHQRKLAREIKRARHLAFLPFVVKV